MSPDTEGEYQEDRKLLMCSLQLALSAVPYLATTVVSSSPFAACSSVPFRLTTQQAPLASTALHK